MNWNLLVDWLVSKIDWLSSVAILLCAGGMIYMLVQVLRGKRPWNL
jgi:hypothetical protein